MSIFLNILLAHLLGDFLLQPDKWVDDKQNKKHKSTYLYFHLLIHAFLILILLDFDVKYWPVFVVVIVSHGIIDLIKVHLTDRIAMRWLFFWDQSAHIIVLMLVSCFYASCQWEWTLVSEPKNILLVIHLALLSFVGSTIIKMLISKWSLSEDRADHSLHNAGMYIGILERFFVFGFVLSGHIEAIGFLLAAKSVFRFGDLSNAKDRKLTEYILIGTLMSFGLAMLIGYSYLYLSDTI